MKIPEGIRFSPVALLIILLISALVLNAVNVIDLDQRLDLSSTPILDQDTEPPVPVDRMLLPLVDIAPVVDIFDSVVKVTNYTKDGAMAGYGIVVSYKGTKFVLSSRMILSNGPGVVTISTPDQELPARVVSEDETWELIALEFYKEDLPAIELAEGTLQHSGEVDLYTDESLPVTTGEMVRSPKSSRSANPGWVIIKNIPPACTGSPLFVGDTLFGVVIGRNRSDETEGIAAGSALLVKLAEEVFKAREP